MEQTPATAMTDLSIVIFSSREPAATVLQAIEHALLAAGSYSYQLHLFFNGDEQRAKTLTDLIRQHYPQQTVQVWFFALADKANCMNQYWHQVKPAARMHFFVDGYVRLQPDSFSQLIKAHQGIQRHTPLPVFRPMAAAVQNYANKCSAPGVFTVICICCQRPPRTTAHGRNFIYLLVYTGLIQPSARCFVLIFNQKAVSHGNRSVFR